MHHVKRLCSLFTPCSGCSFDACACWKNMHVFLPYCLRFLASLMPSSCCFFFTHCAWNWAFSSHWPTFFQDLWPLHTHPPKRHCHSWPNQLHTPDQFSHRILPTVGWLLFQVWYSKVWRKFKWVWRPSHGSPESCTLWLCWFWNWHNRAMSIRQWRYFSSLAVI